MYLRQYSGSPEIFRIGFGPDFHRLYRTAERFISTTVDVSPAPAGRFISTSATYHQHQPKLIDFKQWRDACWQVRV
jgi:hypothetical protein